MNSKKTLFLKTGRYSNFPLQQFEASLLPWRTVTGFDQVYNLNKNFRPVSIPNRRIWIYYSFTFVLIIANIHIHTWAKVWGFLFRVIFYVSIVIRDGISCLESAFIDKVIYFGQQQMYNILVIMIQTDSFFWSIASFVRTRYTIFLLHLNRKLVWEYGNCKMFWSIKVHLAFW